MATGRIWIQIAADEAQLVDAPLELPDAVGRRNARRLRELTDADEVARIQRADPVNQIVAVLGPVQARCRVTDVVRHRRRPRRKDRDVGAALTLELQLGALETLANLIVADDDGSLRRNVRRVAGRLERRNLRVAVRLQRFGRRRVVAVAVDNHTARLIDFSILSSSAIVGRQPAALDSGSRPSRMAPVNSTSWRSNAATPSRGTSLPSLSVIESR